MSKSKSRTKQSAQQRRAKRQSNNIWLWSVLGLVVIALGGFLIFEQNGTAVDAYPQEISVSQAAAKRQAGAFILDVRQPEEWADAHIPGSTLIPLGDLEDRINEVPKDQEIVVVCRSGNRSAQGRDILKQAGFTQVTSMAGGLNEWKADGYETASGGG
jgi:rhodanese-related sulfurtransferase